MGLRTSAVAAAVLLSSFARDASAFTISSRVTEGCHELITSEALRRVREATGLPEIPASPEEVPLIEDLQFTPDDDMRDMAAVALLLAVRDNDLKGNSPDDFTALALVHGDPNNQEEHCLRSAANDEPNGTPDTLSACRRYIERQVSAAIDALNDDGVPDPTHRTELKVHLAIRGGVEAPIPTYYMHMGFALHALEDGFTHTYRTPDVESVTVALNWVDVVEGSHDATRDGPPHSSELDRCDDPDDLRRLRRELATDAAEALLLATLGSDRTKDEKMREVRAILAQHLSHEPGCNAENAWCNAPEAALDPKCECDVPGAPSASWSWAAVLGVVAAARRRRRSRARLAPWIVAAGLTAVAPPAAAQPADSAKEKPAAAGGERNPGVSTDPGRMRLGGSLMAAGAVDEPGLAVAAGARMRPNDSWVVGFDFEWNPWFSLIGGVPIRPGSANLYFTGALRLPLLDPRLHLRTALSIGTSILLDDLYGAPRGTAGLFIGTNLLSLEVQVSKVAYLLLSPVCVAIPVPQLVGVPFAYPQYRLQGSFEFYGP